HRLEAAGELDGIALAGSAAGYVTRHGCVQSGADAVDQLLGRPRQRVEDRRIDPLYETPDAPAFIGPAPPEASAPVYLDGGASLLQRPAPPRQSWSRLWHRSAPRGLGALSEAPQPLTIGIVAAGVDLGLVPPASAGIVAQERVALVPLAGQAADILEEAPAAAAGVPAYLAGRFGADAV